MSAKELGLLYRKGKISKKRIKLVKTGNRQVWTQEKFNQEYLRIDTELSGVNRMQHPIIYIDESVFSLKTVAKQAFSQKNQNVYMKVDNTSYPYISLVIAISENLEYIVYEIAEKSI